MSLSKENTANPRKLAHLKPLSQSRIERNGIKPGTVAPDFTLRDVNGVPVSLQQYGGKRVILVFSDPHCGPCMQLAPYLVRAYERRRVVTTEIVMISRGDLEENRQKAESLGLPFPMVLQDRWRLSKKYGIFATPVAFVVSEDGRTEGEAAVGVEKIRSMLRKEFAATVTDRVTEAVDEVSGVLSSPLPRRQAFRVAGYMIAGAFFSIIGMPNAALAACNSGYVACGTHCCNIATERCTTNLSCCPISLYCNGKCCAAGEICSYGQCVQQQELGTPQP